jgi:tetratricopeptide (TPR) repeat protein
VARLKGYFAAVQPPPDVTKALMDAEQCAADLYLLQTGAAVSSESEAPTAAALSHAQRSRDQLHRLQVSLGLLETRGGQSVPKGSEAAWKANLVQLQLVAQGLSTRPEAIGAMPDNDFDELQNRLSNEYDVFKKIERIEDAARTFRFTSRQVDDLQEGFLNTGNAQARVLETLLPRLTDSENAPRLWARIPLKTERDRIRTEWENRSGGPKTDAELSPVHLSSENIERQRLSDEGRRALAEQRWGEAEAAYTALLKLKPNDADAQMGLARCRDMRREGEYQTALKQGHDALATGDAATAGVAFRLALTLKPDAPEAQDGLRRAEEMQKPAR